ncbi:MAG TPA: CHAT domain-containing tetratricopeptide repeat protein, partial [Puia sp.]|nr:CHAT domain-containing tetratricopeptide repeat protein [Puia sp.]
YTNLAIFYRQLKMYGTALQYYDSALTVRKKYPDHSASMANLLLDKAQMLFWIGDYQKAIEQASIGLGEVKLPGELVTMAKLLDQRAQYYLRQHRPLEASIDLDSAARILSAVPDQDEAINNILLHGDLMMEQGKYFSVPALYAKAIQQRIRTGNYAQVADDYTDLGNFFLNQLHEYEKAKSCYFRTIQYAKKANDWEKLSKAHVNLGQAEFYLHHNKAAADYYMQAIHDLPLPARQGLLINPAMSQLNIIGNKDLVYAIFVDKTEVLLHLYEQTSDSSFLSACLQTALLTDSILNRMRHEQVGEQSKLYWRNQTRDFFRDALQACYLAKDTRLAFFFMEKSRAVLLNDRLNEMGAAAQLPAAEISTEQGLQLRILSEQHKLGSLDAGSPEYHAQQMQLLHARDDFDRYIKSLENRFPVYYQYKYADRVTALDSLQHYLERNKQRFVHYFANDSIMFLLVITAREARMMKLAGQDVSDGSISRFIGYCENAQQLNTSYADFAALSYKLYQSLFQPLDLPAGKIIICPDHFIIPFEALCSDQAGKKFLLSDYIFSYVYSAASLLKKINTGAPGGNFIGFAPVDFQSYLNLAGLKTSASALRQTAAPFAGGKLYLHKAANKNNFLREIPDYSIATVFSHARADTSVNEPILYMQDSMIQLSELQQLKNPATKLVVLSACETNAGRNANGEGIYSLSRGFAMAGIPAVAATLWTADDQSIYDITRRFHENLARGMGKDEALQRAKLDFLAGSTGMQQLPYYWANLVLIGNSEPIGQTDVAHSKKWVVDFLLVLAFLLMFSATWRIVRRKKTTTNV